MIAVVDYGMGNVRSLSNALAYLGCEPVITSDHAELRRADRIVLPGVGAFGDAMAAIKARRLDEALAPLVLGDRRPMLGICLGMQLLAGSSSEHGVHQGLGWLDATVARFDLLPAYKIPHIGWNEITFDASEPLFAGLRAHERAFYFVHSFHVRCHEPSDVIATCDYGGKFVAAVRRGNFVAMQFHPEKSQDSGLRVLENFLRWEP